MPKKPNSFEDLGMCDVGVIRRAAAGIEATRDWESRSEAMADAAVALAKPGESVVVILSLACGCARSNQRGAARGGGLVSAALVLVAELVDVAKRHDPDDARLFQETHDRLLELLRDLTEPPCLVTGESPG